MKHVLAGDDAAAIATLDSPDAVADALFMAGMLALKRERYADAVALLDRAETNAADLGVCFAKYGISAHARLPITERITAVIEPGTRGIALARAEAEQAPKNWPAALDALEALHDVEPDDAVVILSLAEIRVDEQADEAACKRVVELTEGIDNHSPLEAAILYWKGRALHRLNLLTASRDALTAASRRKKDRGPELLKAIRFSLCRAAGRQRRPTSDRKTDPRRASNHRSRSHCKVHRTGARLSVFPAGMGQAQLGLRRRFTDRSGRRGQRVNAGHRCVGPRLLPRAL